MQLLEHKDADIAAKELLKEALRLGSTDNVSAVICILNKEK